MSNEYLATTSSWTLVFVFGLVGVADGQGNSLAPKKAMHLVRTALTQDLQGDTSGREQLLRSAIEADPDCALARWHLGEVLVEDRWLSVSQAVEKWQDDDRLTNYRERRDKLNDSPDNNLKLARWCRQQGLDEQERFHLGCVISDPRSNGKQLADAAQRLDLIVFRGQLVSRSDLEKSKQRSTEQRKAAQKWTAPITRLTKALGSQLQQRKSDAEEALMEIQDVRAIPALEAILSSVTASSAHLSVRIIAAMPEYEATVSLVRHALFTSWPRVAEEATRQLANRPRHEYMTLLLAQLETPIKWNTETTTDGTGQIRRRHMFFREGVERNFVHVLDVVTPTGLDRGTDWLTVADGSSRVSRRVLASVTSSQRPSVDPTSRGESVRSAQLRNLVVAENRRISAKNARVFEVLEGVNFVALPREPAAWWNWWRDYNEVADPYAETTKPVQLSYNQERIALSALGGTTPAHECFCAGTLVWTELGKVPIEIVQAGDRVLAQHPDTGELRFQPVVERTVRPPTQIISIELPGDDTAIHTTRGHPFWVNGLGWRMAKELRAGDRLHTLGGSMEIAVVDELPVHQEAHNLVVAGTGTYFVGPRAILVHDNTYRAPTQCVVPGLKKPF